MDFLDNNKDLPTTWNEEENKNGEPKRILGWLCQPSNKAKKKLFLLTTPRLLSGNQGKFTESKKQPIPSFKACPEAQIPTALFQSPPSLRKQTLPQKK